MKGKHQDDIYSILLNKLPKYDLHKFQYIDQNMLLIINVFILILFLLKIMIN